MTRSAPTRAAFLLPDLGMGGGQVIALRTLEAARDLGRDQLVVALRGGPMTQAFREAGIETVVLGLRSGLGSVAALVRLCRLLRRRRVGVIVSFNTPTDRTFAQLAGALCRLPVAIWFMSVAVPLIPFPPPWRRVPAFLKRLALYLPNYLSVRRAVTLVSLSDAVGRSFAAHLRLDPARFHLVPPGLSDAFYDGPLGPQAQAALRRELALDPDAGPVLLNVGMLIDLKGQQELVPAMSTVLGSLPNAVLLIVGDGENRTLLERLIEERHLGAHVRLLGHRHDVAALLRLADGLVSASRSEGFGMAVLEAMAAGKAVVAVHTPAFEEFARDGCSAVFVAAQDSELLAGALIDVFGDPARCARLAASARSAAENFRARTTAARLLAVLDDVTSVQATRRD